MMGRPLLSTSTMIFELGLFERSWATSMAFHLRSAKKAVHAMAVQLRGVRATIQWPISSMAASASGKAPDQIGNTCCIPAPK